MYVHVLDIFLLNPIISYRILQFRQKSAAILMNGKDCLKVAIKKELQLT